MSAQVAAATRARRQATAVAALAAVVPTILAAQGMTFLAVDLLRFPTMAAVALACFLELALMSSALLARASALAGRPGGADAIAVWVVSATSGLLAGLHQLMTTTPEGTAWNVDPGSALAGVARVIAPLVAAWLWERALHATRAEQAERTLAEVRRDRSQLAVARAALVARRLAEAGRSTSHRGRRAARRLDRAHLAALRVAPPSDTLAGVLAAVGQVDHLPAATRVAPLAVWPDTDPEVPEVAALLAGQGTSVADGPIAGPVVWPDADEPMTGQREPARAALTVAATGRPDTVTVPVGAGADVSGQGDVVADAAAATVADSLDVAIEVVRADRDVSGAALAALLAERGQAVSVRTGQRLRAKALAALAATAEAEPVAGH